MVNSNLSDNAENNQASHTLVSNGEFLFQMFSGLLEMYGSKETLNIISEENETTLAAGIVTTDIPGEMDLDCLRFEPNQESLRVCIDSISNN